ncbi:MAG: threonine/serine exporter family protein [Romboutsia sp.]
MIELPLYIHIIFSFLAAVGFAIFLNSPRTTAIPAGIIGTIGWVLYVILMRLRFQNMSSNFIAAVLVSIFSEILARRFKQPTILFVIPGIIPLIPGLGLYNTMFYLVQNKFTEAISTGANTLFVSGSIALGVLVVSSLFRTFTIMNFSKKRNN